ncbi:MAG: enoyl-CoA hydratase [Comamonas sp.]
MISASSQVSIDISSKGIACISVNRPERHNAMTVEMYDSLLHLINEAVSNPKAKCIVFQGSGDKSFISGTDINHFSGFNSGKQGIEYENFVENVISTIERIPLPTIASIDGWVAGGGLAIATACDIRVCTSKSQFGAPIAKTLSNTLSSKNIARLLSAFGSSRVKRMLILAEFLDAQEALQCGYVYSIHTDKQNLDIAIDILSESLIKLSPVSQAACKESIRRIVVEHSLFDEDIIESVYGSENFRSGVEKFTKK